MSRQNFTITLLSITALVLLLANYFAVPTASADVAIKDRQYQICTAISPGGDDALFVLNNQTGMLSCFSYDPTARRVVNRSSQPVMDLFMNANGALPPR